MPTYGVATQPLQSTFNYDSLVATSLANYRKTLTDNVSTSNIFFTKLKERGLFESCDGGLYIAEDLMYGLAPTDSYDGYDELPLTPTEGITQAQFQWRQMATPFAISGKEKKMNKQRIVDLVAAKLQQCEIGMQEAWARYFIQGSMAAGGTTLYSAYQSPVNGSYAMDPIGSVVDYAPTAARSPGGISQSTNTWWANQQKDSAATTTTGFLQEVLNLFNTCSKGPGGRPDFAMADQTSWELLSVAYYNRFRTEATAVGDYPFPVIKFQNVDIGWDQYMPDAYSSAVATTTYGTLYALNTKFLKVRYESDTNFVLTEMVKPINQDAYFRHILWMGNVTCNNRRKLGVLGKIARTLTVS
jgi:hypothetical protein